MNLFLLNITKKLCGIQLLSYARTSVSKLMTGSTGKESGEATMVKQENGMISSLLTKCYREQIVQKQMLACHGQSLRHLLRMFPGNNRCSKLRAMAKRLEACPRRLPLWLVRWCLVSLHMLQFLTQLLHLVLIQSPLGLIFSNSIKVASAEGNVSTLKKNKTKIHTRISFQNPLFPALQKDAEISRGPILSP